jgi:acyl phosphate:glycerol-3-phosphate acyltransferase
MVWFVFAVFAYLMGSIPVGVILSKSSGRDPRHVGSGNIGATNVMRAVGKTLGIVTLIGDIAKGVVPTALAVYTRQPYMLVAATGFMAFFGHLYPIYLKFKGGKGVATSLGVFLILSPLAIGIYAIVFILLLLKWRYVSVGSLIASALLPVTLYILSRPAEYIVLSLIMNLLIFVKHKDNIKRLLAGKEHKI